MAMTDARNLRQICNGILIRLSRPLLRVAPWLYHLWYYNNYVWTRTTWMGVPTLKSPSDMWNYQEILAERKPSVVIEFGTCHGGSALFFASVLRQIGRPFTVISVDVSRQQINKTALADPDIEFLTASSTDDCVAKRIAQVRAQRPGAAFAILDSDHSKEHVLQEMLSLRSVLTSGDYLVVEDSNLNGHPVRSSSGPRAAGPYEAITEYFSKFPDDYIRDRDREKKFGFTFSPNGFLERR